MSIMHRNRRALGLLLLLLVAGVGVLVLEPVDRDRLLSWGELLATHPLTLVLLVLLQVALYAFALPGSLALWVVAPFAPLATAVAVLLAGSVGGALSAYLLAQRLSGRARARIRSKPTFLLLARRSDPVTQCALRLLPGFPHAVVNYAGGLLELPLGRFLGAAAVGMALKWSLYVSAVQALVDAGDADSPLGVWVVLPLLLLALLLVGGRYLAGRAPRGGPRSNTE